MTRSIGLALAALVMLGACTGQRDVAVKPGDADRRFTAEATVVALEQFDSCRELLEHAREQTMKEVGPFGLRMGGHAVLEDSAALSAEGAPAAKATRAQANGAGGADAYSGTNVQVAGVDEPDVIKTDGRRILAIAGGRLHHVSVADGKPVLDDSIELKNGGGQLFIDGDRALIVSSGHMGDLAVPDATRSSQPAWSENTAVTVVDISDADALRSVTTVSLEGSFVAARMVDGIARLVLRSGPSVTGLSYPKASNPEELRKAESANKRVVAQAGLESWLPEFEVSGQGQAGRSGRPLVGCDDVSRPEKPAGVGMVNVVTLDPDDPEDPQATSIFASAEHVYASQEGLYVAAAEWDSRRPAGPEFTQIHKFDISEPARTTYRASGRVRGMLLNQFSMDEHDGTLRVATTRNADQQRKSESLVTILRERGKALRRIGRVGDLGRDERIYSVRFMGERGYVVTFRQVDPLYVLDLSDPTEPVVRGELKIPGYSSYLHPVGEDRLVGIGQNADLEGRVLGTQLSVFDVSDPAEPKRIDQLDLGTGSSSAEYDHHAFLYWEPTGLLVVPMHLYNEREQFAGALGVRLDDGRLDMIGRLAHPTLQSKDGPEPGVAIDIYAPGIERSLVIGDALYTMSQSGLEQADLASLDEESWLEWPQS